MSAFINVHFISNVTIYDNKLLLQLISEVRVSFYLKNVYIYIIYATLFTSIFAFSGNVGSY